MSVRSVFGPIEPLTEGESIVIKDADGIVYGIQGLSVGVPPSTGAVDSILTSDGVGGIRWEVGAPGPANSLAEVMLNGVIPGAAGNDLDMLGFDIVSTTGAITIESDGIFITAVDEVYLAAPKGLYVGPIPSPGLNNYVLVSRGIVGPPEWIDPPIPTAQGALDMAGFAINNCSNYGGSAGTLTLQEQDIVIDGNTNFTTLPTTDDPTPLSLSTQLTTKSYVDTQIAGAVGVNPASPVPITWVAIQNWTNAGVCTIRNLVCAGGDLLAARQTGLAYSQVDNNINPAIQIANGQTININLNNSTSFYNSTNGGSIFLPDADAQTAGCSLTVVTNEIVVITSNAGPKIINFANQTNIGQPWTTMTCQGNSTIRLTCIISGVLPGVVEYYWACTQYSGSNSPFS
jgi:hypothetical protein